MKINLFLFSILVSLTMFAAFTTFPTVLAMLVSFAAYFFDKWYIAKNSFESRLRAVEGKVDSVSIAAGIERL